MDSDPLPVAAADAVAVDTGAEDATVRVVRTLRERLRWAVRVTTGAPGGCRRGPVVQEHRRTADEDPVHNPAGPPVAERPGHLRTLALAGGVLALLVALRVLTGVLGAGAPVVALVFGVTEAVVAVAATVHLAHRSRDRSLERTSRRTWGLISASTAAWGAGQTLFAVTEVAGLGVGTERWADLLFLASNLLMVTAGVFLLHDVSDRGTGVRTLLDGFLVGVALLTVFWVTWFGDTVSRFTGSGADLVMPLAFPVLDVVFLSLLVVTSTRVVSSPAGTLFVGFALCTATADVIYVVHLTGPGGFTTGGAADYLWITAFGLLVLSAEVRLQGRRLTPRSRPAVTWSVLVPYLAMAPAAVVTTVRLWSTQDRLLVGSLLGLTVLAMARQFVVLADHRRLLLTTENQREQLAVAAHTDALTGLANRRRFSELLSDAVREAGDASSAVVVAFVDLDRFKVVNDTLGHQAGDELLRAVADRLRGSVRPGDWVGRWGGDEFAVLVTDPHASARDVVDRLREAMRAPFLVAGRPLSASASVGAVREVPRVQGADLDVTALVDQLLAAADEEMYEVKRGPGAPEPQAVR